MGEIESFVDFKMHADSTMAATGGKREGRIIDKCRQSASPKYPTTDMAKAGWLAYALMPVSQSPSLECLDERRRRQFRQQARTPTEQSSGR